MQIKLWKNFNKRRNSTKQPSEALAVAVQVTLKESTSVENPIFILRSTDFDYNYAFGFGHYYFITNIISAANGLVELHCEQDVLATYKSAIQNTTAYVLYDTTENTEIVDSRLSAKSTPTILSNSVLLRDDLINTITPIVSIMGTDSIGAYAIPFGNLGKLIPEFNDVYESFLAEDNPFGAYKALITGLMKTGGNAIEYIKDVRAIPFAVTGDTLVYPLMLGNYELSIGGRRIDNRISRKTVSVSIPWQFTDWRNTSPYTDIHMYIPFVGNVSYPASQLKGSTSLFIASSLDILSGDLAIVVHKDSATGEVIGSYGAQTGVSILFGESGLAPMNVANGIIQGALAVSTQNVGGLIGAGLEAIQPVAASVGGISSGAGVGLDNNVRIYTVCHDTTVTPASVSAVMGTPAMAAKSLGSLTGYIKCDNASVSLTGLAGDKDAVNSFLNGGFYME